MTVGSRGSHAHYKSVQVAFLSGVCVPSNGGTSSSDPELIKLKDQYEEFEDFRQRPVDVTNIKAKRGGTFPELVRSIEQKAHIYGLLKEKKDQSETFA
jgi:hypothetical protein